MGNATDITLDALDIGMRVRNWTRAQLETEHDHNLEFYSLPWQAAIIREYDRRANIVETHGPRGRQFVEMAGNAACFAIILGVGWLAWSATPAWAADKVAHVPREWGWLDYAAAWMCVSLFVWGVLYSVLPPKTRFHEYHDELDDFRAGDTIERRMREHQ